MPQNHALIAMSGGVDSSVAAVLTQQAGLVCAGATMLLCDHLTGQAGSDPAGDARAVAQRLGMDFYVLDARDVFEQNVVQPFIRTYEDGLTPNPCIRCNRYMKFGYFLEQGQTLGYDTVVTGHYAQVVLDHATQRYLLKRAVDLQKDQSYFLACLDQYQLSHSRFPLGALCKEQTRQIALEQGLITAGKRDSQDICFIPDGDYVGFMTRYTGKTYPQGAFLDPDGRQVGIHNGAVCYTLGQRRGLGLAMGQPVYVCAKDMAANTVTVAPESALYATTLRANDWNWFPFETLSHPMQVMAKARYRHTPQPATVYPEENGSARVVFREPQRALTPGQSIVLYDGDWVVGGGTITQIL